MVNIPYMEPMGYILLYKYTIHEAARPKQKPRLEEERNPSDPSGGPVKTMVEKHRKTMGKAWENGGSMGF